MRFLSAVDETEPKRFKLKSRSIQLSYAAIGMLVAAVDSLVVLLASLLAQGLYDIGSGSDTSNVASAVNIGLIASVLYVSVVRTAGLYDLPALMEPFRCLRKITVCCLLVILSVTGVLFLLKVGSSFSRGSILGFGIMMMVLCLGERFAVAFLVSRAIRSNAVAGRDAFLIGDSDELSSLSAAYLMRQFGIREVGRYAFEEKGSVPGVYAQVTHALSAARDLRPKEIVIATNGRSPETLPEIERAMRQTPLPVKLIPNTMYRTIIDRDERLGRSMPSIELQRAPLSGPEQVAKRLLDVVGAGLALLLLMPLLLGAAVAIRLDTPGPVIFRQRRNGFNEVPFTIYKFRTMTVLEDGDSVIQARRGDRRITRVGAFLRRSSIDELPQLINVLRGEMSLVGPRPHALVHDEEFRILIGNYFKRHHVKPGMTGWAQIHGFRGETLRPTDIERRVELDLWYIDNWSLPLEVLILLRTVHAIKSTNAY